jgi:nucleoside-diphosphate-sugar epimerase
MSVTLVTGGTGFVGRHLVAELLRRGVAVRTTARASTDFAPGVEVRVVEDLARHGNLDSLLRGVDCVMHLAARAHVTADRADDNYELYRISNEVLTDRLAKAAAANGVRRFILMSTIKVFGEVDRGRPFAVGDQPTPVDAYGRSKLQAEQALWAQCAVGTLTGVVVRSPLVYGPGVRANFLRLMGMIDHEVPLPFASVRNRRSLVATDNLVDLLCRCREQPAAAGGTFLVSDGEDLSTPELMGKVARALRRRARLFAMPPAVLRLAGHLLGRSAEVARLIDSLSLDIAATRSTLAWDPPLTVDEALQKTVDRYLATRESRAAAGHAAGGRS